MERLKASQPNPTPDGGETTFVITTERGTKLQSAITTTLLFDTNKTKTKRYRPSNNTISGNNLMTAPGEEIHSQDRNLKSWRRCPNISERSHLPPLSAAANRGESPPKHPPSNRDLHRLGSPEK